MARHSCTCRCHHSYSRVGWRLSTGTGSSQANIAPSSSLWRFCSVSKRCHWQALQKITMHDDLTMLACIVSVMSVWKIMYVFLWNKMYAVMFCAIMSKLSKNVTPICRHKFIRFMRWRILYTMISFKWIRFCWRRQPLFHLSVFSCCSLCQQSSCTRRAGEFETPSEVRFLPPVSDATVNWIH